MTEAIRFSKWMAEQEALLWRMEADPRMRSTLVAVTVLDRAPDRARLVAKLERAGRTIPRLRERIAVLPAWMSTPAWVHAPHFDLDYHLRFVRAPGEGSLEALLPLAASMAMQGFDPSRPPWELLVVEGLADGKAAMVQKLHHSMTDGIGGVLILGQFYDASADATDDASAGDAKEAASAGDAEAAAPGSDATAASEDALRLALEALLRNAAEQPRRARRLAGLLLRGATSPVESARLAARDLRSLRKLFAAGEGPLSPLMRGRTGNLRFACFRVPLPALKAAAHAAGCKLNDAFLAATAGGWRRYHERHGAPVEALRVAVPINRRAAGDHEGGVQLAVARIPLPLDETDPIARMRVYRELIRSERDEPYQGYSDATAWLMNRLPLPLATSMYASAATHNDFVASSVPGPPVPLYVGGARVEALYAFGPLSGAAANLTLFSYGDQAHVTLVTDRAAVADADVLTACMREGFDEVMKLG